MLMSVWKPHPFPCLHSPYASLSLSLAPDPEQDDLFENKPWPPHTGDRGLFTTGRLPCCEALDPLLNTETLP